MSRSCTIKWARRTWSHEQVMHHNMNQEDKVSHEKVTVRKTGSCSWTHSLHFYMCSHKKGFLLSTSQPQWLCNQQSQFQFQHSSLPLSPSHSSEGLPFFSPYCWPASSPWSPECHLCSTPSTLTMEVPPKHWYPPTRLHNVTTQNKTICVTQNRCR